MKNDFAPLLLGKDLRSIARSNEVARAIADQQSFDDLFSLLFHHERLLVMRAADAVEKVTLRHPLFLQRHKEQLLTLLKGSMDKELKWHIALLIARVTLTVDEAQDVLKILRYWIQNPNESKIARVNSLQGLYEITLQYPSLKDEFIRIMKTLESEQIPSLQARRRKLQKIMFARDRHHGN